jgi:hypothetical protein
MALKKAQRKLQSLVLWPNSAQEMLLALKSYARLQSAYPLLKFELILYGRTLPNTSIDAVLIAEHSLDAAEQLMALYLDLFD